MSDSSANAAHHHADINDIDHDDIDDTMHLGVDALDRRCYIHAAVAERLALSVGGWARGARTSGLDGRLGASLAAHSAQLAWHARLWAERAPTIDELPTRSTPRELDELLDAVDAQEDVSCAADGLYGVILLGLADLHAATLEQVDARLDGPTARVLTLCLRDLRAAIDEIAAGSVTAGLAPSTAAAHRAHLADLFARCRPVLT